MIKLKDEDGENEITYYSLTEYRVLNLEDPGERDSPGNAMDPEEFEAQTQDLAEICNVPENEILMSGDEIMIPIPIYKEGKGFNMEKMIEIFNASQPDEIGLFDIQGKTYLRLWWD